LAPAAAQISALADNKSAAVKKLNRAMISFRIDLKTLCREWPAPSPLNSRK
jgi:hypothetical protein